MAGKTGEVDGKRNSELLGLLKTDRRGQTQAGADKNAKTIAALDVGSGEGVAVELSLGKDIATQLDPQVMASERAEKKARLKKLIEAGNYRIESKQLAAAVSESIDFEVGTLRKLAGNN